MNRDVVELSVIVPVYEDWSQVPALLKALEGQSLSKERFEVLLVDNGSSELPDQSTWPAFVRLLHCQRPGSYAARNQGAAEAKGRYLVFTDADCQPEPNWLAGLRDAFASADEDALIVAGAIRVLPSGRPTPTATELYDRALGLPQARYVRRGYGVTANLAVPQSLFKRLEGFEERRFSGGDAEFCRRAVSRDAGLMYCAAAEVKHPARVAFAELARKARRVKGGQLRAGPMKRRVLYFGWTFLPPVRMWWRILKASEVTGLDRFRVALVQARLWVVEMLESFRLIGGGVPERR